MPRMIIDPARLEGDELRRWYLRSPTGIEEERQADAAQQHDDFFRHTSADMPLAAKAPLPPNAAASSDEVLWVATGSGGYRAVRPKSQAQYFSGDEPTPSWLPGNPAAPGAAISLRSAVEKIGRSGGYTSRPMVPGPRQRMVATMRFPIGERSPMAARTRSPILSRSIQMITGLCTLARETRRAGAAVGRLREHSAGGLNRLDPAPS